MEFTYKPRGVCTRQIDFTLSDDHTLTDLSFTGGCSGNTQGVAKLAVGRKAEEVIKTLGGIRCGMKTTSCPDQLAQALTLALEKMAE